ncbi:ABC transporter ATP-binding protein [Geitlerinema calcuttense]|uniref:ABC transporter ATP-binding protein n=1 Tax=Geitlerinema calcuttense NRMC-F 0142 TaxID=2922238 RepID=A0ABT7LZW2_9CYAN|nr:ABC transporter ATP-binding protein [Geitlerinema calcuttense]MDL5057543.1 ABC transporter ATP-binding protein [Geitlerinema calcuttense NRMC-F 0142]
MQIPLQQYGALLANYLKPQWGAVVGLTIALLTSIALQIINPQILSYFIDTIFTGGEAQSLPWAALAFSAIALLTQVFSLSATYWGETVAWTATNALRSDLVAHCLQLDLSFHKAHTPGELLERVDGDVNALSRFFSQLVIHVFGNGILLIGILVVLWFENPFAGMSLTLFAGVALSVLLGLRSGAIAPWAEYRQISAEFYGTLGEQIAGREDICANGAVPYVMYRFYALLQHWLPVYHQARFASTVLWFSSVGLFTLGNAIALTLSAYLWQQNAITIGTAYLIFHYTNLLSQPIERIREELEQLQQVEASIYRIRELLSIQPRLKQSVGVPLPSTACAVTFENVYFRYQGQNPDEWTLHNVSFSLPPGQVLGILGRTGSGKSTIARLLLRFYDIQSGEIRLGEGAIAKTCLSQLRQRVGLVTQDVQLFQASVRDNLTFFDPHISDTVILEAMETLLLSPWLKSLPNGLNTQLGAESSGLSAGQAQLLALVRVFLKNPSLVILDEASSRLDPQTEALLERAIDRLLSNRTGIIIAHRLQTLKRADRILILEQGKVVEYGDRQTLLSQSQSQFAQLLNAQTIEHP